MAALMWRAASTLAAATLLHRRPNLDAIYAFNDMVAVGAMQACQESGKSVPEDIAIIGVDDIPVASFIRPQLTTLHVDLRHIGNLAVQMLLARYLRAVSEPEALEE